MCRNIKTQLRDLLPLKIQVPTKYWYGRLRGRLEKEMALLPLVLENQSFVLDIGGNRGTYAYCLRRLGARVEVFEPNPKCFSVLSAWGENKGEVNIHYVALSNQVGSANLYIPIDDSGEEHDASASIESSECRNYRKERVILKTLDSFKFEGVDFIKIDVEGHEYSVIQGAEKTISESKPALLIEIEQRHNSRAIEKIFEKVLGFGYKGFFLQDKSLQPLEEFDPVLHQAIENFGNKKKYINNFLFLHTLKFMSSHYENLTKQTRENK